MNLGGGGRHLLLLLALLDVLSVKVGIGHGHDHQAFIQSDSDLRYLVDDGIDAGPYVETIENSHGTPEGLSENTKDGIRVLRSPIKFDPPELDFDEQPTGLPVLRKVRVYNLNAQSSIQMMSISGNTIHFHCSFFTDKVIPPSGNTTFDVVFLGREEGLVENTLYIHTSAGSFRFNVKAKGTPNPYRLRPLVGLKIPVNSSFSPVIKLHNPHPEPIQVLEMYSSGGDLHLELPNGETEGSESVWQIPPYQTKPVIKANFVARLENNHTAYIRIKTNTTGAEFLYLPLEVEVTSQPGIYSPQDVIDFGLVPTQSEPKSVKILLLNSGSKAIQIQSVIATPVTEAINVNFKPLKVQPEILRPKVIAEMVFNPNLVKEEGLLTGKIVIKSKNSQFKVQLPYRALLLKGQLSVNSTATQFHLKTKAKIERSITVKNEFGIPLAVHNMSLAPEALNFFDLNWSKLQILEPGQTKDLSVLSLKNEAWEDKILNSHLTIHTNISNIHVPLLCFHGQIDTFFPGSPSQDILDFGTLGMGEKRDIYFAILNKNPIGVTLRGWGASLAGSLVEVVGVDKGNETEILKRGTFDGMTRKLIIPPGHYLIFRLGLYTTESEGAFEGHIYVETSYHTFKVQYKFRVAKGSLHTVPKELVFDPVFPGEKSELKLKVSSSFAEEMITDSVMTVPPDPRFSFKHSVRDGRTPIMSGDKSFIGWVVFDPGAVCRFNDSCYVGFKLNSKIGKEWQKGLSLPSTLSEIDYAIAQTLHDRGLNSMSSSFNITLNLDTNHVRGFLFKARAKMIWPQVGPNSEQKLTFALTQVGNFSYKEVVLQNPSMENIFCHLVPLSHYPNGHELINALPKNYSAAFLGSVPFSNDSNYKITSLADLTNNGGLESFGGNLADFTKGFLLKPKSRASIKIKFQPETVGHYKSGLFVRNNLTGIEFVEFFGEAVHGEIKFGKFKSSPFNVLSSPIFDFDMKDKHLKGCFKDQKQPKSTLTDVPLFTVKRGIKVKNLGLTSLYIKGFSIEDSPCEGFGFRVLNCEGFNLEPNETKEIIIAFTPDFTLSKISRKLTMSTSIRHLEALNYTLMATVPVHMLHTCSKMLPRPTWEPYLYWGFNVFMLIALFLVVCCACVESDRIYNGAIFQNLAPYFEDAGQLLDLRGVADLVHRELNNPATVQEIPRPKPNQVSLGKKIFSWNWSVLNWIWKCFIWILKRLDLRPLFKRAESPKNKEESEKEDDKKEENQKKEKTEPKLDNNQNNNHQNNSKKSKKKNLTRKKSLPNLDLEETSSTTTESSAVDELNDSKALNFPPYQAENNSKKNKEQKKPAKLPSKSEPNQNQTKKKAKKQNSSEGSKKTSPERPQISPKPEVLDQPKKSPNLPKPKLENLEPKQAEISNPTPPKKVTPVGKILPEIKRPENHGAQFGPVGAKPIHKPNWNSGRNDLNDTHTNGFNGPPQIQNTPASRHLDEFLAVGSNNSSPSRSGPSLMTQFQLNRRQETAQFLSGGIPNDWPGFSSNTTPPAHYDYVQNLWDNVESTPLQPPVQQNSSIWNTNGLPWSENRGQYIGGLSVLNSQQQNERFMQRHQNDFQNNPFGINSIWSQQPEGQRPPQQNDELNYQQHVMQHQRQQQPQQQQQAPPSMNNSWSNTLFRNK